MIGSRGVRTLLLALSTTFGCSSAPSPDGTNGIDEQEASAELASPLVAGVEKTYSHTSMLDFAAGSSVGTEISADGAVRLQVNPAPVLSNRALNWGHVTTPAQSDANYVWIEAEDVITASPSFISVTGNSVGLAADRWSASRAMLHFEQVPQPAAVSSNTFQLKLPLTGSQYFVHVRTENQNCNTAPSTINLYVDGGGTPATTGNTQVLNPGAGTLAWHRLSVPIPGSVHNLRLELVPNPSCAPAPNVQEEESIDTLLFTTDGGYTPPNPIDTKGKLDSRKRQVWIETEDLIAANAHFTPVPGNSVGLSPDRWSNRLGMLHISFNPIPPVLTTQPFDVSLPWGGVPYYVHVRTENQSWNSLPSRLELYMDGSATPVATGSTDVVGSQLLAWHRLTGSIPGGSHQMYIKLIPHAGQTVQEEETLDTLFFTTDLAEVPPNPTDTNGKLVGASVFATGSYDSPIVDTGTNTATWYQVEWDADVPEGTSLTVRTRTGPTATVDSSWSPWSPACTHGTGEAIVSPPNRYIQYTAAFGANPAQVRTPILKSVTLKAGTAAIPQISRYGVYTLPADGGTIPQYVYNWNKTDLAFYDFSVIQADNYPAFGQSNTLHDTLIQNPNHRIVLRLTGWWGGGQTPDTAFTVLNYADKAAVRTSMRALWTAQVNAAVAAAGNIYAVTISEEEPGNAWRGLFEGTIPTWLTANYQQQFLTEANQPGPFNWDLRWKNGFIPWLQGKTKVAFNDVYNWLKASYPTVKVLQFMYTPGSNQDFGNYNLGPDASGANGYKADGWVTQYIGTYSTLQNWLNELRSAGIANDQIYMQLWAWERSSGTVAWQTRQARSLGIENVFAYYAAAWIPPNLNYPALDTADGNADGTINGVEWPYTYGERQAWETQIQNVRQLAVTVTAPSSAVLGSPVSLSATAFAVGGQIGRVEFYRNGVLLASDSSSPFTASWTPVASGAQSLTAKVFDSNENSATSAPVTVTVYDLTTQLVARWNWEQNATDTAAGGTPNNGSLVGGMTYSTDRMLGAFGLNFVDTSRQCMTVGNHSELNPTSRFSLTAWVKVTNWTGARRILQKGADGAQYRLFHDTSNSRLAFEAKTNGVTRIVSAARPSIGVWHHVAATYDGSNMMLYVDGGVPTITAASGPVSTTTSSLYVGAKSSADTVTGDFWKGVLDDVRVYNGRALTRSEIQALMTVTQ